VKESRRLHNATAALHAAPSALLFEPAAETNSAARKAPRTVERPMAWA
jgi:hypothetical protein